MSPDCFLELRLKRPFGEKDTVLAVNLGPEYRMMPDKDTVAIGPIPLVSFDEAVEILKQREIGGQTVRDAAERLGRQMAERLEDEQGWHGEGRRERTRRLRA